MVSARRRRSRDAVLAVVQERTGVTRRHIEQATGLSRGAVAETVADLLVQGLLESRQPAATSDRGRPPALLVAARPSGLVLGLDFGHAHVAAAVAATDGSVLAERRVEVDVDTRSRRALDAAARLVDELLGDRDRASIRAAAAGIPGPIDAATKLVRSPTILSDWVDVDAQAELEERLGVPVIAGNDANMGAIGEGALGAARGVRDFIYVKASHGIGAGLVLAGAVYSGAGGLAGEIGHTQVTDLGGWCRCGNRGCLETVVSIAEIQQRASSLEPAVAQRVVHEAGRTIGKVLADLCNCLNPAALIIGGELATYGDAVVQGVAESISRLAQPATARMVQVRAAQLGLRSELVGAVTSAMQAVGHPGTRVRSRSL